MGAGSVPHVPSAPHPHPGHGLWLGLPLQSSGPCQEPVGVPKCPPDNVGQRGEHCRGEGWVPLLLIKSRSRQLLAAEPLLCLCDRGHPRERGCLKGQKSHPRHSLS